MNKFVNEIKTDKNSFNVATIFESWQVAYLNFGDVVSISKLTQVERHMKSDEIFILVEGSCHMIVGGNDSAFSLCDVIDMKKNTIYSVSKGVWHHVLLSEDAKIFIVEESNTSADNGEYYELTEGQKIEIVEKCNNDY